MPVEFVTYDWDDSLEDDSEINLDIEYSLGGVRDVRVRKRGIGEVDCGVSADGVEDGVGMDGLGDGKRVCVGGNDEYGLDGGDGEYDECMIGRVEAAVDGKTREGMSSGGRLDDRLDAGRGGGGDHVVRSDKQVFLSREQQLVLDLVTTRGKSVFFTGPAGTGKSVLMRAVIGELQRRFKGSGGRVAVTASTGLAACNIGGVTLHSFAGVGLGKEGVQDLVRKIRRNGKARLRWVACKVLVIDEVSMVDAELFEKLEEIARILKRNKLPFGGIQLVMTGDFLQLPPVPDRSGPAARYAFEAECWSRCVEQVIGLREVFRQTDSVLAGMLNELRMGTVSEETVDAFRELGRELPSGRVEATELFPTRREVENANSNRMRGLTGDMFEYVAVDTGKNMDSARIDQMLTGCMAPKTLQLKRGAQVMLVKNVDESLVNGSVGKVICFCTERRFRQYVEDDADMTDERNSYASIGSRGGCTSGKIEASKLRVWPVVLFSGGGGERVVQCCPEDWRMELPSGEVQVQRRQVPVVLAWALSIHKSQGQTLDRVKVDLRRVFECGQAYVALSRAVSRDGLCVRNFRVSGVMVDRRVREFYLGLGSVADL